MSDFSYPNPNPTTLPTVLILNGPNLNLLGQREPHLYGHQRLSDIFDACDALGRQLGLRIEFVSD